jgi:hypothetical protein
MLWWCIPYNCAKKTYIQRFMYRVPLFCSLIMILAGCHSVNRPGALRYEEVTDSMAAQSSTYTDDARDWKSLFEGCLKYPLFANGFYIGLQDQIRLGSICNRDSINVNGKVSVLDTSGRKNIFDLLAIVKLANCYAPLHLDSAMRKDFYRELFKCLQASGDYAYLTDFIDSSGIEVEITEVEDNAIRPDSLVSLLARSKVSSLVHYRQILESTGNAVLIRAAMISGFICRVPLKKGIPAQQAAALKNAVLFRFGREGGNGSIQMQDDQALRITINKNYTVFGQFYNFKQG